LLLAVILLPVTQKWWMSGLFEHTGWLCHKQESKVCKWLLGAQWKVVVNKVLERVAVEIELLCHNLEKGCWMSAW